MIHYSFMHCWFHLLITCLGLSLLCSECNCPVPFLFIMFLSSLVLRLCLYHKIAWELLPFLYSLEELSKIGFFLFLKHLAELTIVKILVSGNIFFGDSNWFLNILNNYIIISSTFFLFCVHFYGYTYPLVEITTVTYLPVSFLCWMPWG